MIRSPAEQVEEIRKALKAADLMKMLDGQKAIGSKSGTKALGEHKVSYNILQLGVS